MQDGPLSDDENDSNDGGDDDGGGMIPSLPTPRQLSAREREESVLIDVSNNAAAEYVEFDDETWTPDTGSDEELGSDDEQEEDASNWVLDEMRYLR